MIVWYAPDTAFGSKYPINLEHKYHCLCCQEHSLPMTSLALMPHTRRLLAGNQGDRIERRLRYVALLPL